MIRACAHLDHPEVGAIINDAAQAYQGVIPADCWKEPYMTRKGLAADIAAGVSFVGWDESGTLLGVMGIQRVRDVTLIRHAYVRRAHQGRGIGGALLTSLIGRAQNRLLVGTWAAADWAIRFYENHGFQLVPDPERERLLSAYWTIPRRQLEVSVALERGRMS